MDTLQRLGVALAIGILIGVERGWHDRAAEKGSRPAGIRTFGVIGILGALWAMLAADMGTHLLGFGFLGFALLVTVAHSISARATHAYGATTMVAALVTFALGALCVRGDLKIAAAVGVVVAVLLGLKPVLHSWVERLESKELLATLKLLLISVVMLPALPDRPFGPWKVLNPFELWLMVVLIAGISFIGYFAIKIGGPRLGIGVTGVFGGLASSTALTLSFSRLGKQTPQLHGLLASAVVIAASTMFPRMLIICGVIHPGLLKELLWPFGVMSAAGYAGAAWLWWRSSAAARPGQPLFKNPLELGKAVQFGILLATIMLLAKAFQVWLGNPGIYMLAGLSGLTDVDAITLSLSRMVGSDLTLAVAGKALMIVAVVNTLVKGALTAFICGGRMSLQVNAVLAVALAAGAVCLLLD